MLKEMVPDGGSLLSPAQRAHTHMAGDEAGHGSNFCEESNLEAKGVALAFTFVQTKSSQRLVFL